MKTLKKIIALIMALIIMSSFVACEDKEINNSSTTILEEPSSEINHNIIDDVIKLGSYEQDGDLSSPEEIEWIVLAEDGDKKLIISKYILDIKTFYPSFYSTDEGHVTWENSSIRIWLNGEFYTNAFDEQEKSMIISSSVKADENPDYEINQGNETIDKIFLLSANEANKYFESDKERKCEFTGYANMQLAKRNPSFYNDWCGWWLRSIGRYDNFATIVHYDGSVRNDGRNFDYEFIGVRPVMWINSNTQNNSADVSNSDYYKGKIIEFGQYEQDNDSANGKENINWIVVDIKDNKALVVSQYVLDYRAYNASYQKVTWEKCSIRQWLNNDFFNMAFNETEQSKIIESTVINEDYIDDSYEGYNAKGGNDTKDRIFLLSSNEAEKYLEPISCLSCEATAYANPTDVFLSSWWLRTPKNDGYDAFYVMDNGAITEFGVNSHHIGVRPTMWINID